MLLLRAFGLHCRPKIDLARKLRIPSVSLLLARFFLLIFSVPFASHCEALVQDLHSP